MVETYIEDSIRAGGKSGKQSCWKSYIMLDARQTNRFRMIFSAESQSSSPFE